MFLKVHSSTWSSHETNPAHSAPARADIIRITDNRLRAIRYWMAQGQDTEGTMLKFIHADLKRWVAVKSSGGVWFEDLKDLVDALEITSTHSFKVIYEHLGREYPRVVSGSGYIPRREMHPWDQPGFFNE